MNVKASRAASGTFLCASDGAGSGEGGGDVPQLGPTCPAICFKRKKQKKRFILGRVLDLLPLSSITNTFHYVLNEK